jgi:hypothetical protein
MPIELFLEPSDGVVKEEGVLIADDETDSLVKDRRVTIGIATQKIRDVVSAPRFNLGPIDSARDRIKEAGDVPI